MTNLGMSTLMNNLGTSRAMSRDQALGKEMNGSTRLIHTLFCKEKDVQRRRWIRITNRNNIRRLEQDGVCAGAAPLAQQRKTMKAPVRTLQPLIAKIKGDKVSKEGTSTLKGSSRLMQLAQLESPLTPPPDCSEVS